MKAHNDYITVELIDEPSGVIIPDEYKNLSPKGRVTSVGHKVHDIKVGDIIYYYARRGESYQGQEFIKASEVLGILLDNSQGSIVE